MDGAGSAYVTGRTSSSDFPTTPGAFDTNYNGGGWDAFVVKLNPAGSGLVYATFLGGSSYDYGWRHRRGRGGQRLCDGHTPDSSDFPTTPGAFDTSYNGGRRRLRGQAEPHRQRGGLRHIPGWRGWTMATASPLIGQAMPT